MGLSLDRGRTSSPDQWDSGHIYSTMYSSVSRIDISSQNKIVDIDECVLVWSM